MRFLVPALLIPLSLPTFAADGALLNFLMPDAIVMGGIDVQRAKTSAFAKSIMDGMPAEAFEKLGLDPKRDLDEIIFASSQTSGKGKGIFVVRGRLNPTKIGDLLKTLGPAKVENRNGQEILTQPGSNAGAFALIGDHTALLGDIESVRAAVDRKNAGARLDASKAAKALRMSQSNDVWAITDAPPVSNATSTKAGIQTPGPIPGLNPAMMKTLEQGSVGLRFAPGSVEMNLEATAKSDKDAGAMADVVRFMASMAQLNRDTPEFKPLAAALENMQLSQESRTVRVKLVLPQDQLEKVLHGEPKRNKRTRETF